MAANADDSEGQKDNLITVRRTMEVLEMLGSAEGGLSLTDIAAALAVNKSIALRLTSTLSDMGYIYRDRNKRYFATYKVSNMAMRILERTRLVDQCRPALQKLAEQTGELVLLSVVDQGLPRWIMAVPGMRRRLQVEPLPSVELHSTATGKAWLATLSDTAVAKALDGRMQALTPFTITDLDKMLTELAEIRATDISFSNQENEVGIAAVATAIRLTAADEARCVGFVSITAPLARTKPADFERYRTLIVETARKLGDAWPVAATAAFSNKVYQSDGVLTVG